ncbi:MAG: tRNA uridine-5-carboxymethylaminomethyl(34) synthesis GTPase MnmE [Pseudomonadota bacterium]
MARYLNNPAPNDTIYAPATAPGRAAISVIRVSGQGTSEVLRALTLRQPPPPRLASVRKLMRPADGAVLDEALILRFEAPESYTGEDAAELHCHGSPLIVDAVSETLDALGVRLADAGEFTRRALMNGRLDLAQAEAVSLLIAAEDEAGRRTALRLLDGELGRSVEAWTQRLLHVVALLEAAIDFSDEDIGEDTLKTASQDLAALQAIWRSELEERRSIDQDLGALTVAVIGPPNVGKSSFLNAVARRDLAIVSEVAGTTRDVVRLQARFGGVAFELIDTAGLRETNDVIEAEGVRRTRAAAEQADHRVLILSTDVDPDPANWADFLKPRDLVLLNKADLNQDRGSDGQGAAVRVSVREGSAMAVFESWMSERVRERSAASPSIAATGRQRLALQSALDGLDQAEKALAMMAPEVAIEAVKGSISALGSLSSGFDAEDVLGEIFSRFCIGK